MKTLLLISLVLGACVAPARTVRTQRNASAVAQTPTCKEIPTLTGKPMRCEAERPSVLRP